MGVSAKRSIYFDPGFRGCVVWALMALAAMIHGSAAAASSSLAGPGVRTAVVNRLSEQSRLAKEYAESWASIHGVTTRFEVDGVAFELMRIEDGRPIYYRTLNENAAISTAADLVRNKAPYNLNGEGLTIGLWDAGMPRKTHQEFQNLPSRITWQDDGSSVAEDAHSTHVAGTLGAWGKDAKAMGMAPSVEIGVHDWNADASEMAAWGASYPGEPNKIYLSNHSYGPALGWVRGQLSSGKLVWVWLPLWNGNSSGWWGMVEPCFGQYGADAADYDEVAFLAPYYLIFVAAGNERADNPTEGETVYYSTDGVYARSIRYAADTCPLGDGKAKAGYDTIHPAGVAKNVVTVGAVTDAVRNGVRDLNGVDVTASSSWGPADDGRVKPDVVADGQEVYSTTSGGDDQYAVMSGTSMACANASGSAVLLVQYYGRLFPGKAMRASTLKGLILHTADDLGDPGPDYRSGWGLLNVEAAAALIREHAQQGKRIVEAALTSLQGVDAYQVSCDGARPLRVTLCWTDPAGTKRGAHAHDDRKPCLVNDLDLRIIRPDGTTVFPYVLDVTHPEKPATQGDNRVDNVEQVYIPAPSPGAYTLQITHKADLAGGQQWYSLVSSLPVERSSAEAARYVEWTRQFGGTGDDSGNGIAVDHSGNAYVTGSTRGALAGSKVLSHDVFLCMFNPDGGLEWTRQMGGTASDIGYGVAVDELDNVYVTGDTGGGLPGLKAWSSGTFVAGFDTAGTQRWIQQMGTVSDYVRGVSADGLGNLYVTIPSGFSIARFDSAGTLLWTRAVDAEDNCYGCGMVLGVSADGLGNAYVTGRTSGSLGGLNAGGEDAFVAKFDAAGTRQWIKQMGTWGDDYARGIAADGLGNVFITGETNGSLGGPNAGGKDLFVAKYTAAGSLAWVRQMGADGADGGLGITADGQGNAYVTGCISGSLGSPNMGGGGGDVFAGKFDSDGNLLWIMQWGSDKWDCGNAISLDHSGGVYVTGWTQGSMGRPSAGAKDVFVTKIRED